ncbi:T6SS effector amidase Tae4 family protein [Chryseobacterium sp. MEBOG07]|uniref:T6SS effector amidase Tae4 family protein n=1 Tax=Chryseobacterium sp. MEBOG07 TaxID=2879939 RepID=UPI001F4865B8|nr:T6SS effector amidase Tae4 family protein [Chryseobacterium sp. MEBOG07]UKB77936.1 type VI secretion system amidase effector protein Tae4 [Chryseobacterium sp. MEBOG07]
MKNKFIVRLLSLVTIMVLLYSCRNELSTEQEETHSNSSQFRPTSKTIRLEQSKHKLVLKTELQKAQNNLTEIKTNASGKSVDFANGVSIDTDNVTYIEYGPSLHTYTFNLVRENAPENAPLENLVLSSLSDGSYKELLVTYNFTQQEKLNLLAGKGVKTAGRATAIELVKGTYGGVISNRSMGGAESCSYKTVDMYFSCYTGEHHQGNESSWGECNWQNKGGYAAQHITMVALVCTADTSLGIDGSPGGGDMGPTTGLGGGTDTPTIPTLSAFFFYVKRLPADLKAVLYDTANTEFYDGLKKFYDFNYGSAESGEFITWALQFKQNNPNTSWEQFENWFLGTSEGKADENYDTAYWDNPNLTFPPQSLPSWQNYYDAFPKDVNGKGLSGPAIYEIVKGTPKALRDGVLNDSNPNNDHDYDNACALRVSIALNYSGVKIPNIPNHTFKGGDGKYYFLSAKKLNAWMRKTFGTNPATSTTPYNSNHIHITGNQAGVNGVNLPVILKDIKGIYSLVSSNSAWASGHGDILQPNGTCINGCHFYDAPIDYIDVWILQ